MTVSSKTALGIFAAALMAGGLLSACSTKNTPDGGSGTGGTTGGACGPSGSSCTVSSECCTNLTCQGGTCAAACGALTDSCSSSSPCCSPLICDTSGDQNNNTCIAAPVGDGGNDAGCALNPPGGGCITLADCAVKSNVCLPASDGGGYCGAPTTIPSAVCVPNGQACTAAGSPCCGGSCVNNVCVARSACGIAGQGCNVAGDCCNNYKCVVGTGADNGDGGDAGADGGDAGVCGVATSTCAANTDCCTGLICDLTGDATNDTCITAPDAGTTDAGTDAGVDAGLDAGNPTPDAGGTTYAGTCQPSCGGAEATCDTSNGNADCCQEEGFTCLPLSAFGLDGGATAGLCYYAQFQDQAGNPVYCGSACSDFPCQLGASCQIPTTGANAGVDPCAAAGYVCDQQGSVCRNPSEQDSCVPGGPACQPLADSTVTNIQCLAAPAKFGGAFSCVQPCALTDPGTGTSDCVDPLMTCTAVGGGAQGAECFFNEGCTTSFGACNAAGVGDGVCVFYNFSGGQSAGLCFQATLDGGAPGTECNFNNNRQNGGFCNPTSYCVFGTCEANCNSGTTGTPACAQNDAGPVVTCTSEPFGQGGQSSEGGFATAFGTCSPSCDFTAANGGGCPNTAANPEWCGPPAYFGLADAPTGFCTGEPPASQTFQVGEACVQSSTYVNTCVDGALCLGTLVGPFSCVQLCTNVNNGIGVAPCTAGQTCYGLDFGSGAEAHEGYCSVDGGFGT